MFEAGSKSSDQYNPDSCAFVDVSTSTSNKQPDTTENRNINSELLQKTTRLEKENQILHGRLRGYQTLGSLLQEEKKLKEKLKQENEELKRKLLPLNISVDNHGSKSSTSLTNAESQIHSLRANMKTQLPDEFKGEETSSDSIPTSTDRIGQNTDPPISMEVVPMQESPLEGCNDLSAVEANPSMSMPHSSPMSKIDSNLQIDSDRFEDPEYEKFATPVKVTTTVSSSLNSPKQTCSSSSIECIGHSSVARQADTSLNMMTFPSLASRSSRVNEQSVSFPSLGDQVGEVANQLNNTSLGNKLRQISDEVDRQHSELMRHKNLNTTLCEENRRLKASMQIQLHEEKSKNYQLRVVNQNLEAQLRELENKQSSDSIGSQKEWVQVEKPGVKGKTDLELFQGSGCMPTDTDCLSQMVKDLEHKNRQLKNANDSWRNRWNQLEMNKDSIIKTLETELAEKKQELNRQLANDVQKQQEFEHMLCAAKSHAGDEENAKEEALQKLHVAEIQINDLKEKVKSLENDNVELVRAKHAAEAELSVLKKQANTLQTSPQRQQTVQELKTEIAVLREQLTLFEEDFEKERQDRALTQSAREDIQKKYEEIYQSRKRLNERLVNLQGKVAYLDTQLNNARHRIRTLETENKQLKNENIQLKRLNTAAMYQQPPLSPYPPGPPPQYKRQHGQPLMPQNPMAHGHIQLEHLPGAWTCSHCTYVNIPQRSICEMCGNRKQKPDMASSSLEEALMSRGHDVPDDMNDLVTDNGEFQ